MHLGTGRTVLCMYVCPDVSAIGTPYIRVGVHGESVRALEDEIGRH